MIKAVIKERYIHSSPGAVHDHTEEIIHDTRFFSTLEKYNEWYDSFKDQLWMDDLEKVDPTKTQLKLAEGIFVETSEVALDDMTPPEKLAQFATFRKGVSTPYAK